MAPNFNRLGDAFRLVAGMTRVTGLWADIELLLLASLIIGTSPAHADSADDHFERVIRPLLVERCHACHARENAKGGLRLDSRAAVLAGGDSGPAVTPGQPARENLLIRAVNHTDGLEMPPDGRLPQPQIESLVAWVSAGAPWPDSPESPDETAETSAVREARQPPIEPLAPDHPSLGSSLQFWLKADSLALDDGAPVPVWPDASGHGRDASATKGVRPDGQGLPGTFVRESAIARRPAVRFTTATGYASSPALPIPVAGDASLTLAVVVNLRPHETGPPFEGILGVGDPANPGADPGRPLAAVLQINRAEDHALRFAGGWMNDASAGNGSFKTSFGRPTLVVAVKQPGPIRTTTRLFIDGREVRPPAGELEGRDGIPDLRHRVDIGAFLGKAVSWCGSIEGDIGEALVFSSALDDKSRVGLEAWLSDKYALDLGGPHRAMTTATYTPAERAHWAYQPLVDPPPPSPRSQTAPTAIDRFLQPQIAALGVPPVPEADRATLLRRVTFDLIGLPPTPAETAAFLADTGPDAWSEVVNRLLASPHYGEQQARHWLDVVRYAETTANDANAVMTQAWRYRNWVVDACNRDLPYDRFLVEQLAGDLLPPSGDAATDAARTIATGFLMIGPKALAETDKEQSRLDIVDDQIDVTGRAFLGLTLACARCHDHKFDAVRTTDYYALAGIFRSTEPFQNEVRNATMWWEYPVPIGDGKEPAMVMAPKEALPRNLRVHLRGNRFQLGAIAPRGIPGLFRASAAGAADGADGEVPTTLVTSGGSGRLELARWIADAKNPLTARVMVNRIWQQHFGRGLVATSDNFGTRGEAPSHPELLDWLACRFIESGWSVKDLHRLILTSAAYRRAVAPAALREVDPDGRTVAASQRRRLTAEQLRDAILATSGGLDRAPGSDESAKVLVEKAEDIGAMIKPNRLAVDDPVYTTFTKRSLYLPAVRNMLPDVLSLFDAADPNGVTAIRNETTVPSQALFLVNSPFVRGQALQFARSLLADTGLDDAGRIDRAHFRALGRRAAPEEITESLAYVAAWMESTAGQARPADVRREEAWQSWCQALLCSNEFAYLD
jgi:cytochrome c553